MIEELYTPKEAATKIRERANPELQELIAFVNQYLHESHWIGAGVVTIPLHESKSWKGVPALLQEMFVEYAKTRNWIAEFKVFRFDEERADCGVELYLQPLCQD